MIAIQQERFHGYTERVYVIWNPRQPFAPHVAIGTSRDRNRCSYCDAPGRDRHAGRHELARHLRRARAKHSSTRERIKR